MDFDEQLRRALETLSERLRDGHRQALEEAIVEAVAAARAETRTADLGASQRLVEAVRAIGAGGSLTEILDTLAVSAGREASRVGVLLVRGETFCGWRFIGFGPAFPWGAGGPGVPGDNQAPSLTFEYAAGGVVTDAVRSGAPASGDSNAPDFAELPSGLKSFAVPLIMGGQIVAVLYADHGAGELWTDTLEVLARHAARCLEALTATKAARALTERPDLRTSTSFDDLCRNDDLGGNDDPSHEELGNDEHAAAHRYARLLVSEIKLYHETAVAAGLKEGDLTLRLGGEIAHARSLYDQRVPLAVRQHTDYFHSELVRTLANGDAALLEVRT